MLTSTFSMWTFRVMLGVYFAQGLQLGVLGIWGAMFVDWVFRTTCLVIRYRGHKWEFSTLKD